jgi:hypothetical protein
VKHVQRERGKERGKGGLISREANGYLSVGLSYKLKMGDNAMGHGFLMQVE